MADASEAGGAADSAGVAPALHPPRPLPLSCGPHSLHHCVPTGREVVFVAINEGYPEVEEQVDEKGPSILSQEDLGVPRDKVSNPRVAEGRDQGRGQGLPSPS